MAWTWSSTSTSTVPNAQGVEQKPCIDCGDCVTGCNVGAKNTLYMNYLPVAQAQRSRDLHSNSSRLAAEARHGRLAYLWPALQRPGRARALLAGGWQRRSVRRLAGNPGDPFALRIQGLSLSPRVGTSFNGNGDFFGMAYNSDFQTNIIGFGNSPDHYWRKEGNAPGPSIVGAVRYNPNQPLGKADHRRRPSLCRKPMLVRPWSLLAPSAAKTQMQAMKTVNWPGSCGIIL